jgi:hypothetical protein
METGNVSKPVAPAAAAVPARVDILAAAGAVKTQLAPDAAVQQAGKTPAVRAYVREMREAEDKGRGGSDVPRVEKIA